MVAAVIGAAALAVRGQTAAVPATEPASAGNATTRPDEGVSVGGPAAQIENRNDLEDAWRDACRPNSAIMMLRDLRDPLVRVAWMRQQMRLRDEQAKRQMAQGVLQQKPRDSLEVLVDILYPRPTAPPDEAAIKAALADLHKAHPTNA